jgi:hypothetical protein
LLRSTFFFWNFPNIKHPFGPPKEHKNSSQIQIFKEFPEI